MDDFDYHDDHDGVGCGEDDDFDYGDEGGVDTIFGDDSDINDNYDDKKNIIEICLLSFINRCSLVM